MKHQKERKKYNKPLLIIGFKRIESKFRFETFCQKMRQKTEEIEKITGESQKVIKKMEKRN